MNPAAEVRFGLLGPVTRCECEGVDESMPLVQFIDRTPGAAAPRVHQFHWADEGWAVCEDLHPVGTVEHCSASELHGSEEAGTPARLLAWMNSVPMTEWRREGRRVARSGVTGASANLDRARTALAGAREGLRQARCEQVVADLVGTPAATAALRLLTDGWAGSPAQLRAAIRATTAPPA